MSLIGPRPVEQDTEERYQQWSDLLFALKPGFIGPWWLSGRSRPTVIGEEIDADLRYARAYTFWMDIGIVLKALGSILPRIRKHYPRRPTDEGIAPG
jgi:lipopolysaccharide/colanic/teichoic acid biosynthesis glycosyltransferase